MKDAEIFWGHEKTQAFFGGIVFLIRSNQQ